MRLRTTLIWFIGLLALMSLACAQAGSVISYEDATATAEGKYAPVTASGSTTDGADFAVGDTALLAGKGFLINLMDAPGGRISAGQQRGADVEILSSTLYEDEIWYEVDSSTGTGWIKGENLEPVAAVEAKYAAGDNAYLVGTGFLISLMKEPGGLRMIAGQERGVEVEIVEYTPIDDGTMWYLIDAPTGKGWVAEENLSDEVP